MRSDRAQQNNTTEFRKPIEINFGAVIFLIMIIYIFIGVVTYLKTDHLRGYEVKKGSLYENNTYRAIVIRDEELQYTSDAGYVYYLSSDGAHVACGDLVYALDSSGTLEQILDESFSRSALTDDDLSSLKEKVIYYNKHFDEHDYSSVYNFKYELQNEVSRLNNSSTINALDQQGASGIKRMYSDRPGDIVLSYDGMEDLTAEEVTDSVLEGKDYELTHLVSGSLFGTENVAYRIVTSEDWSLVLKVEESRLNDLSEGSYMRVRFVKDGYETYGKLHILSSNSENQEVMIELKFNTSMRNYITDRYLNIELSSDDSVGLKIPQSTIASRTFFLIPEDYVMSSGTGSESVIRRTFNENNEMTTQVVDTPAYNYDEKEKVYYIDEDVLNVGDVLYKPDSQETYTVSKQATLEGVYNINKGYADFRQIIRLKDNEEYAIVESNTQYGLRAYDYIALDADTVMADQFVTTRG